MRRGALWVLMYPGTFARSMPDSAAAIMADTGALLTWADLEDRSTRLAQLLYRRGLRRGDTLAVLSTNDLRVYEAYWAAKRSGLYITAINHHLTASEISYIVNDCGARVLVVAADLADTAGALLDSTPGVTHRLAWGGDIAGHEDYEVALAGTEPIDTPDTRVGGDMLYSSGTTGRPKAIKAPLKERRVDEPGDPYVEIFAPMYGFDTETVYLSPAPLYHAAPLRFGGWVQACGGTVVVMSHFDPVTALETIEKFDVTHSQWVPTMFVRMLKLPDEVKARFDLSSLKVAIHAAAPCPVDVKMRMIEWWGPILYEYYSCTEGMGITLIDSAESLAKPGSVGRSAMGILHVCDDEGRDLPPGSVGTVYFEREVLPFTYHNDPQKTKDAQHPHHSTWTTSGDLGYLDDDGYLFLTDRKAFTIISGGVNVYPQEVENVLTLHPKVADIAVIGVPDPDLGERVHAFVQPAPGVDAGPDLERELLDFVVERIARFKAPRTMDFVTELPRTPTGKLVKAALRRQYAASNS